jgi:hypothetical protein
MSDPAEEAEQGARDEARLAGVIFRCYIPAMPSPDRTIALLALAAADILAADAKALRLVRARKDQYALYDAQPAAAAMAGERRASVATTMRTSIAPRYGWILRTEHFESGAYEWDLEEGVLLRLSKTTRESRQDAALASMRIQSALFDMGRPADSEADILLVRLMGSPLGAATVDVAHIDTHGRVRFALPMVTIAKSLVGATDKHELPSATVDLPEDGRQQRKRPDA